MRKKKSVASSLVGTDTGNAEYFAARNLLRFRYCAALGGWHAYDAGRWVRDESDTITAAAKAAAKAMLAEAEAVQGDARDERVRLARQTANRKGIENMLRLAQHLLVTLPIDLDRSLLSLNVQNGLLDLASGKVAKHRPEQWVTKLAPVKFVPEAGSAELDRFLEAITEGDGDYLGFLQRACGYTLSGDTSEDAVFVLLGPPGSGKSSLLRLFGATLGDYATCIPFDALIARRHGSGGPRPELDRCKGARLVTVVEANESGNLDPALLKSLSGGDRISTHAKYLKPTEWDPRFKLWIGTNTLAPLPTKDMGSRRRLRVLPFEHAIPEECIDRTLRERLAKSPSIRSAFLAWAVRGLHAWKAQGLGSCEVVERATTAYWDGARAAEREAGILATFLAERCVSEAEHVETSAGLYAALRSVALREEVPVPSTKRLGVALRAFGCKKADIAEVRRWRGLRLRPSGWTSRSVTDDRMTGSSEKSSTGGKAG